MQQTDPSQQKTGVSCTGFHAALPAVPDHELVRCIGKGSYGEVWLARNAVGFWRAVKVVYRDRFKIADPMSASFTAFKNTSPSPARTRDWSMCCRSGAMIRVVISIM